MNLLVLGGTRFLGRHFVSAALERGHTVTIFARGRTPLPFATRVTALVGDRDPRISPGLAALADGTWDAVVDTSGYVPRIVDASTALLKGRTGRYLFVSSVSVYAKADRPGIDESGAVAALADPSTEDILPNYGALKAACERVLTKHLDSRATIVRPGLIVGPFDGTDRFGYWIARFAHPTLLGDRPPEAVVPAPKDRSVQFIDARDLATWLLDLIEGDVDGTYNACSPAGQWTMDDLVAAASVGVPQPPQPVWVDDAVLAAHGVHPWVGLPLWLPATDPEVAGFMQIDCSRARHAGLRVRPLFQTAEDTAAWLATRDNGKAWQHVLSAEQERAILAALKVLPTAS
jgi:2'-hydroxyisoflavone reductase